MSTTYFGYLLNQNGKVGNSYSRCADVAFNQAKVSDEDRFLAIRNLRKMNFNPKNENKD